MNENTSGWKSRENQRSLIREFITSENIQIKIYKKLPIWYLALKISLTKAHGNLVYWLSMQLLFILCYILHHKTIHEHFTSVKI